MTNPQEHEPSFERPEDQDAISKVNFEELYQQAQAMGAEVPNDLETPDDPKEREATAVELIKAIHDHLDALAAVVDSPDGVLDLTGSNPEDVISTLDSLTGDANVVLHGGRNIDFNAGLEPTAVALPPYLDATTDAATALFHATTRPNVAASSLNSPFDAPSPVYGTPEVGQFVDLQQGDIVEAVHRADGSDPTIYSQEGYIFILDRHQFNRSTVDTNDSSNWTTTEQVKPLAIIKVAQEMKPSEITRGQSGSADAAPTVS